MMKTGLWSPGGFVSDKTRSEDLLKMAVVTLRQDSSPKMTSAVHGNMELKVISGDGGWNWNGRNC